MEWQINMFHDCSYTVDAVKNFTMNFTMDFTMIISQLSIGTMQEGTNSIPYAFQNPGFLHEIFLRIFPIGTLAQNTSVL